MWRAATLTDDGVLATHGHDLGYRAEDNLGCTTPGLSWPAGDRGDGVLRHPVTAPREAIIRLVGAVLAEQHDEWAEQRRYLGLEVLARARAVLASPQPEPAPEEVSPDLIAGALSA